MGRSTGLCSFFAQEGQNDQQQNIRSSDHPKRTGTRTAYLYLQSHPDRLARIRHPRSPIALRIGLKLIGANPASPFAVFLYGFTGFFLLPFAGLTATPAAGGMVLEISSVIAMVVYALLAWGLERLIWVIFYRPRAPVVGVTQTTTTDQHTHP